MSKRTRLVWIVAAWLLPLVALVLLSGLGAPVPVEAQPYAGLDGSLEGWRAPYRGNSITAGPALTLVKSTTTLDYAAVGDTIDYSYLVENTGDVALAGPVTISDDKTTATCADLTTVGDNDTDLDVGETVTCTAVDYEVAQGDIDFGSVTNTATASAGGTTSNEDSVTVNATQTPELTLVKSVTETGYDTVGDVLHYSYLVENTGNVRLLGPVMVSDDKATDEACPAVNTVGNADEYLDPGESMVCTASYTIKQPDVNAGSVTNIASASADGTTSNTDTETVNATQTPELTLVKSVTETSYGTVGDVLHYSYLVENTGNVRLLGPVTVSDDQATDEACPAVNTVGNADEYLDPGESIVCTASYTIDQADLDAGSVTNIASASADGTTSNTDTETVDALQSPVLTIVKSSTTTAVTAPGQVVPYSYLVENTGNVTLNGVMVTDNNIDAGSMSCPDTQLDPGEPMTCSAQRMVTQAEMDAGGTLDNTGTADSDETAPVSDNLSIPIKYTLTVGVVGTGSGSVSSDPAGITCPGDCSELYIDGTVVTLTAAPGTGSTFTGWSAAECPGTGTCVVTMDAAKSVEATFTLIEYTVLIDTAGQGSVSKSPDQLTYHYGDVVTLTAVPAYGWQFREWSVDAGGSDNPLSLLIDGDKTVVAIFERVKFRLSVNLAGTGSGSVSSNPEGIACPGDCTQQYEYETVVTLTATEGMGSTFTGWSGSGCSGTGTCVVTMDAAKGVVATFTPIEYNLTISTVGSGSVSKDPNKATYHYGDVVELTAQPAGGWTFSHWSGDVGGAANPVSLTIEGDTTVTANFTQAQYTLTINTVGDGSVEKVPDKNTYTYGEVVALTAVADLGWTFSHWSGDLGGSDNPASLVMNRNKTVTATFTQNEYRLTVVKVGSGSVSKSPDKATYHYGDRVELTAEAAECWSFSGWSGDLVSSANPASLTIDGDMTVVANFIMDEYILTVNVVGNGHVDRDPDRPTYNCGEVVQLTAVADPGWSFSRWSGALGGSSNPASLTMNHDKTVTATFTRDEYILTIHKVGSGSVDKDPNKTTYRYGDVVELTGVPAPGWDFSEWSGDVQGSENPVTVTVYGNMTIVAGFTEGEYTLTVNVVGSGSVERVPDKNTYHWNEEVELTADPAPGWEFSYWSGDVEGTDNPAELLMNGHKVVTAWFVEQQTLTVHVAGGGRVNLDPPGTTFDRGTEVTLTAIPDSGWLFDSWAGDLGGSDNPATLMMDADKSVTAKFVARTYLPSIVRNWPPLPGVPTLYAIDNPDGLRTYTIGWSSAPNAESYVLEEATDRAFADAHQIYAGSSTSHTVNGRVTGRYYYRVKSRNAWAESGWSAARSADVRWEVEPNDEIPQANGIIVSGLTYYGIFPGSDDEKDYFCFGLTAPHRVQIWLTNIPAGRNYDLVLRKENTDPVAWSLQGGNADEYIDIASLPVGFYYVQVYRTSGEGSSQPYHLKVVYE